MSFQFVNATPGDIEYSAETRRRIRSQAMRDYRRRQRDEDNELDSSPDPSLPSASASPELSSHSQSREDSRRRQSSSQSLSVQPEIVRRHSSGTSSDIPPPAHRSGTRPSKRRSPQSPLESEQSQSSQRRKRRNDEPRAQHGVFSQFMVNLPKRTTPPTMEEDIETFNSPGRLDQILEVCDDFNAWLTLNTPTDPPATQERGWYDDKTSQMLLSALALKSIGHLEAVRPHESRVEKDLLKTRVLALLNKRLENPSKALEDNTIGALACLASYEMSQGSSEATMHLTGLQQIIHLRGGTGRIGHTAGLRMLLEILDLTHAVYFHTSPLYTAVDPSQPSSTEETPAPPARPRVPGAGRLDQAMLDDISNFILSIPDLAETGEELPQEAPLAETVTRGTFEDEVEAWDRWLREAGLRVEGALGRACQLAADAHLLSISAVQPHPMRMRAKTDELFGAVSTLSGDAWEAFPAMQIRVLLTALGTAPSPSLSQAQQSYYLTHLTRALYQTASEDWPGVKGLVLRFVEMQSAARRPRGPRATTALAGGVDVEIVVGC